LFSGFADKDSHLFCDFLQQWPTLKAARQARRSTLERFFHEHNVRKPALISERIEAIKNAHPLTDDEGVIGPFSLLVSVLAEQLRDTLHAIEAFDQAIAEQAPTIPTSPSSTASPPPGPSSLQGSSSPSANSANASLPPSTCSAMPAWFQSQNAAATPAGFTGAYSALPSFVKPSSNGPPLPSPALLGCRLLRAAKAQPDTPPCVRSPTIGSAPFITAGSPGNRTMRRATSMPSSNAVRRY